MRIEEIRTIAGPNVFCHSPVLIMTLDLENLDGQGNRDIPGFNDRLLDALPGMADHHCGLGFPGGFVERAGGGTYFGHIVEHVALELAEAAGIPVNRGKTVETARPGVYEVAVTYRSEAGVRCLLQIAVDMVQALVDDLPFELDLRLAEVRKVIEQTEPGPSTKALLEAARSRNIPTRRLNRASLIQFGYGKHRRLIEAAMTSRTSASGADAASDKHLTKAMSQASDIPVPRGFVVGNMEAAVQALRSLEGPAAIKPLNANQDKGVTLNVRTAEEAARAFDVAKRFSDEIILEELYEGRDYRVLVVNGKAVAATHRTPARITGHGRRTVRDANLSTGGPAVDVTAAMHRDYRILCERAARIVDLDICSVDLIVPDISLPYQSGGIVGLNAAPGLRMHIHPSAGTPRDVAGAILETMYPDGVDGRIPIVAITGSSGKTTTARLIAAMLAESASTVGLASADGIWIGKEKILQGEMAGAHSAQVVLSHASIDAAVVETARCGIVRSGLGYDWSSAGVITNLTADHLGQDGIDSVADLARIAALVAERVMPGGTLILNADDHVVAGILMRPQVERDFKRVVWFSMASSTPLLNDHRTVGGTAYFPRDGWLIEAEGMAEAKVVELASLNFSDTAGFQIENILAAVAGARALGCETRHIQRALAKSGAARIPRTASLHRNPNGFIFDYGTTLQGSTP